MPVQKDCHTRYRHLRQHQRGHDNTEAGKIEEAILQNIHKFSHS
jgi:hypothetical protein